ncbi:amino acid permease [Oleiagrimonas soli]|uniref:APA family basic amino acid/polyamine antiporter n=1 Tax=Oleiagrimonas soli TaxID=1543381 RepID=A0A099CSN6_9GAMM|nr:amino acid permease [Oleiagrimonas soli]KGI76799.1 amino acid permease [Oleiagrimonas soli]MBB6184951.1 APA family basic amino acid/polyamine antiporter [Oleiagrimonas soli]
MGFWSKLIRRKSVEQLQSDAGASTDFRRTMGVWQLTAIGIGAIVGVGVFVLAPHEAALNAGPAVVISFLVAGIGSACAALSYAEFAGMIPVTGSAYTYGYAVLGELPAWIIGWDLLVEYALIVGVVAAGTSNYLQSLIADVTGLHLPIWLQGAYDPAHPDSGRVVNIIAVAVALGMAWIQIMRTEIGARFNTIVVSMKVIGVGIVIVAGAFYVHTSNWTPFIPDLVHDAAATGGTRYGMNGVLAASSIVFFAVFGYDTLTTAAEESKNPQRDLPLAVLASLGISMLMYLAISLVLTGMVPYNGCVDPSQAAGHCDQMILASQAPVSAVFAARDLHWISAIIDIAAVCGIASVVFAFMLGAARIWFALSRDGLLPGWFAKSHPKYGTPYRPTMVLGIFTALAAGFLPIRELAELVNIGTLSAFILICASVLILRIRRPELERRFRTPAIWVLAPLGILFSLFLIIGWPWFENGQYHPIGGLDIITIWRFVIWMAIGLAIYLAYGMRHSKVEAQNRGE